MEYKYDINRYERKTTEKLKQVVKHILFLVNVSCIKSILNEGFGKKGRDG